MMASASHRHCFKSSAVPALFAFRPWVILSAVCAALVALEDPTAATFVVGVGAIAGLGDACWTYIKLARNRILIDDGEIIFVSGTRELARVPIGPSTTVVVEATSGGILEYISAAYSPFAHVRVSGSKAEMEYLVKTTRQIANLQTALDNVIAAARVGNGNEQC